MDEREANNLPPTLEQMQSRQAAQATGSRRGGFMQGARSVARWIRIIRFSIALIVGIGFTLAGGFFLIENQPGGDTKNFWYLLLFGFFLTVVSTYMLRRLLRPAPAPPPNPY